MAGKSSGTLRRAIGLAKSFLVEKLEDQKKDSKEDVTKFDEEELVEFLKQTHQDHEQIRIQVEKIQGYEDEWDQMILRDPREVEVKANYITKYGSYMAQVEAGHKQMQDMEAKYREAWDRLNAKDATKAEELFTPEELVTVKGKKAEDVPRMRTLSESSNNDGTNAKQQMNGQAAECPRIILCEARIMERQDQEIQGQKMDQSNAQSGAINVNQPEQKMLNNGPMMMTMSPFHFAMPQWKKLRKLPDITNSTSPAALQEFYINAQMIFNKLMSLGCEMDNLSTADAIESKLPFRVVRKAYTQGCRDTPYKASELLEMVGKISRSESLLAAIKPTNEQRTTTMAVQNRHGQGKNSMNNRQKEKVKKPCKYCVEERMMHHPMDCRKYATNEERKVRAGQLQLCFKCLEAGHVARDCSWKCKECQGKHHFTMCHKREQQGQGRQQHPRNAGQMQNGNSNQWKTNEGSNVQQQSSVRPTHGGGNQSSRQYGGAPNRNAQQSWNNMQQGNGNQQWHTNQQGNQHGNNNQWQGQRRQNQYQGGNQGGNYRRGNGPTTQTHLTGADEVFNGEDVHFVQVAVNQLPMVQDQGSLIIQETPMDQQMQMNQEMDSGRTMEAVTDDKEEMPKQQELLPVIMMTVDLPTIDKDGQEIVGTVFFDSGSNTSYISNKFVKFLGLTPTGEKKLHLSTFASTQSKSIKTNTYNVSIKTKMFTKAVELCAVDHIANNIVTSEVDQDTVDKLLNGQQCALYRERKDVDILIGLDNYLHMLGQVNTLRLTNGLQLNITECGPIVSGRETVIMEEDADTLVTVTESPGDKELGEMLTKFWSLEANGIIDVSPQTKSDEEAAKYFHETTRRNPDGRFVVRLPFCDKNPIKDNRQLSWGRLMSTIRRLEKDEKFHVKYADIIKEQIGLDFIEKVHDEKQRDGHVVHYLAHHPIIKESSKSTKVRMVFDGSAKLSRKERSLNDHLHTGERLLPDIAGVLLRIRNGRILIPADIQKAFLQMELNIADRDATRFLWMEPGLSELECYRFKRVPFGLKPSPYLLNQTLKILLELQDNEMATAMLRSLYVDNVYLCVNSIEEAKAFYHYSKGVFAQAQMNLCQYVSNSKESNDYFMLNEKCEPEADMQKLLGVKWDTKTDELIFAFPEIKSELLTKRKTLKTIAGIYDPQGYLTPTTLSGKLFFQMLNDSNWDEPLSKEQHLQWNKIVKDWKGSEWRIPRMLFDEDQWTNATNVQLHVFTDASKIGYGAVAYLRLVNKEDAGSQFLMSKSRVAPKKGHSIPQLEMLGLLCGVLLAKYVLKEMDRKFDKVFIWTDSMCCLDTLKSGSSGNQFVKNRVKRIQELDEGFEFTHVAGKLNPADYLTRGLTFEELKNNGTWLHGPKFLQDTKELPIRRSSTETPTATLVTTAEPEIPIDPNRFGSFHRMLRTVMLIVHFITLGKLNNLQKVFRARRMLYRWAQWMTPPSAETISSLRLTKDQDNIWIYTGRVNQRPLVYLPQGRIAKLLVLDIHRSCNHSSPLFTLTQLRTAVWIPRGRSFTKKALQECYGCRNLRVQIYQHPEFGEFPDSRVKPSKPFENCGVDYAGPLSVKVDGVVKEIYFVLFTCLYSRFVYTEVVRDMETTTFLHVLRHLCAVYGIPKSIICDNAVQFKMMSKVLESLKNQQRSGIVTSTTLPEFKFIPAHSPWAGGVYERLIGLVKRLLTRAGTTRIMMTIEDFITTLAECTSIVNCRPLTYVAADDDITALRPIDFVYPANRLEGIMDLSLPPETDGHTAEQKNLMETWSRSSSITEDFQLRWNREYVQVFQERQQFDHRQKSSTKSSPKVGDVVLIEHPSLGKSKWPMGRIVEVNKRSAKVKNGKTKRIVEYPWKSLFPLETSTIGGNAEQKKMEDKEVNKSTTVRRSPRLATIANQSLMLLTLLALMATTATAQKTTTLQQESIVPTVLRDAWEHGEFTFWDGINIIFFMSAVFATCYLLTICLATINGIGTVIRCVIKVFRGIIQGLQFIWTTVTSMRKTRLEKASIITLLLLGIISTVNGCNEIASIKADEKVCVLNEDRTACYLNTVSILNVRPNGSIGCYRVRDEERQVETFVEVQPVALISTCIQKTLHFSRDFAIEHSWAHRCWTQGTCKGTNCEDLKPDDVDFEEFSMDSRKSFGYSRCYKTCGCITCGLCGFCSPSCLLSRIYAMPKSTFIYEVFLCPAWKTALEVNVNVNGNRTKVHVDHGIPYQVPNTNITMVITGFSTPPTPVHGATFIKRWKADNREDQFGFTYTSAALAGAPTKGLIGEFQCATYADAKEFKCVFAEELCNCFPQGTVITCSCAHIKIDKLLEKSRLPTVESGITVNTEKGQVITKLTTSALVAIQLQFRNQSVHRIVHNDTCTVQDANLEGCYSCGEGAQLSATCFSVMNNRIEATVRCPTTGVDFLECTKEGQRGVLTFQSAAKMIEEKCTVQCGTSVQEFAVKGELEEEVTFNADLVKEKFAEFTEFISTDNFLNNIGEVIMAPYNKVVNFLGSTALIGLMLLAAIIGLQCYLGSFGIGGFGGSSCLPECRRKRYKRRRYRG